MGLFWKKTKKNKATTRRTAIVGPAGKEKSSHCDAEKENDSKNGKTYYEEGMAPFSIRPMSNDLLGSAMFSYAQLSSAISSSFTPRNNEKNRSQLYFADSSDSNETREIHPVLHKRDIYIGPTCMTGDGEARKPAAAAPLVPSAVNASMICRNMSKGQTQKDSHPNQIGFIIPSKRQNIGDSYGQNQKQQQKNMNHYLMSLAATSPRDINQAPSLSTLSISPQASSDDSENFSLGNSPTESIEGMLFRSKPNAQRHSIGFTY